MSDKRHLEKGAIQYSSLLIYSHKYGLMRLRCPFRVVVLDKHSELKKGSIYLVHAVQFVPNLPSFRLKEGVYPYWIFAIIL